MREIASDNSPLVSIAPQVATATVNGAWIDLQNFDAALIEFIVGIGGITFTGSNYINLTVEHSDDGSTALTPAATDFGYAGIGGTQQITVGASGVIRTINAAHAAPSLTYVAYLGGKRYVRANGVFVGTHATGTGIATAVSRAYPRIIPTP